MTTERRSMASRLARVLVLLMVAGFAACSSSEPSAPVDRVSLALSSTVAASADTYVSQLQPNRNYGSSSVLELQPLGNHRAFVRFAPEAVATLPVGARIQLRLRIAEIGELWGLGGRDIAVHRVTKNWTENGATFNCAIDSAPTDLFASCSGATDWEMGILPLTPRPWVSTPTATTRITNASAGTVSFDVTADIASFRAGTPNYGWIIRKTDELLPGRIELASRETSTPPVLVADCAGDAGCEPADAGEDASDASPDADADAGPGEDAAASDAGADAEVDGGPPACEPAGCDPGDGNECMIHECTPEGCVHRARPDDTPCSDADACTSDDHCSAGSCVAGAPTTCMSPGPCATASCDPAVGCQVTPVPSGSSCETDSNVCTGVSTCDGNGTCQPGVPPTCVTDNPCLVPSCDPVLGCQLPLHRPAPAGRLYFAESNHHRVWRLNTDTPRTLTLIAGTGTTTRPCGPDLCDNGGPANVATLANPRDLEVAPDGSVFVVEQVAGQFGNRIRRIGPEGTITVHFSTANAVGQIARAVDGSIYAIGCSGDRFYRIDPSGIERETLAANINVDICKRTQGFYGSVAVRQDGSMIISCYGHVVLRTIDGTVHRIAGPGQEVYGETGNGGSATRALFQFARRVRITPSNEIVLVQDGGQRKIRKLSLTSSIASPAGTRVPDGSAVFEFDAGRHLRTLSALRGVPLLTFGYSAGANLLETITDETGNVTRIDRPDATHATITSPFGLVTKLLIDPNGYLSAIENPESTEVSISRRQTLACSRASSTRTATSMSSRTPRKGGWSAIRTPSRARQASASFPASPIATRRIRAS